MNILLQNIYLSVIILFVHVSISAQSTSCDTIEYNNTNLGIYGGLSTDLTFSPVSGRLFAIQGNYLPLFYSDDTANTWSLAYPEDSLDFPCSKRGWGFWGNKVISNSKGWIFALTGDYFGGKRMAAVVSFNNGEPSSWVTALDTFLLGKMGYSNNNVLDIGITDNYLYIATDDLIIRMDSTLLKNISIVNIKKRIPTLDSNARCIAVAPINNKNFEFYMVVEPKLGSAVPYGSLHIYKKDSFQLINIPAEPTGVTALFTLETDTFGDTILITGMNKGFSKGYIYKSNDEGNTWSDISVPGNNGSLSDVDYNKVWAKLLPQSNGYFLSTGNAISKDMGKSWINFFGSKSGCASYPFDTTTIAKAFDLGTFVNTKGGKGKFDYQNNYGLEGLLIRDIRRTKNKSVFYIATGSGLAYSTAYLDTSISNELKWKSPLGAFPVNNTAVERGIFSVDINPTDSTHVIAGFSQGFLVSKTGPDGFTPVIPFLTGGGLPLDIKFITSNVILSVFGGENSQTIGKGILLRSQDGGYNWSDVSPSGFSNGRTLATTITSQGDTVIYLGTGLFNYEFGKLWRSDDLGLSWTFINNGLTDAINNMANLPFNDIEVYPGSKDTLYLAAGYFSNGAVAKSYDGGYTYQYLNLNLNNRNAISVLLSPDYPDSILYISSDEFVYEYNLQKDTFKILYQGHSGESIDNLTSGSLLCGTTTGFYSLELETIDDVVVAHKTTTDLNTISIFPNPTKDIIHIKSDSRNITSIKVYNLVGTLQENIEFHNHKRLDFSYDLSDFARGLYLVKVTVEESAPITFKISKK